MNMDGVWCMRLGRQRRCVFVSTIWFVHVWERGKRDGEKWLDGFPQESVAVIDQAWQPAKANAVHPWTTDEKKWIVAWCMLTCVQNPVDKCRCRGRCLRHPVSNVHLLGLEKSCSEDLWQLVPVTWDRQYDEKADRKNAWRRRLLLGGLNDRVSNWLFYTFVRRRFFCQLPWKQTRHVS